MSHSIMISRSRAIQGSRWRIIIITSKISDRCRKDWKNRLLSRNFRIGQKRPIMERISLVSKEEIQIVQESKIITQPTAKSSLLIATERTKRDRDTLRTIQPFKTEKTTSRASTNKTWLKKKDHLLSSSRSLPIYSSTTRTVWDTTLSFWPAKGK